MGLKIVAGLGNPGAAYVRTPHNAGFAVLDLLAERLQGAWRGQARLKACLARVRSEGAELLLAKPQTYMNLSGEAVGALLRYYAVAPEDLVVVADDADLPAGRVRVRPGGGAGGHRGLLSVIGSCGTEAFARVRVGVGRGAAGEDLIEHVLGRLGPGEEAAVRQALSVAADAVLCLVAQGVDAAMNRYNGWSATGAVQPGANERG
jgi:PTH1 family peptidyl-tRNA hydrolase